jgi:hypothetical protein
MNIHIGSSGLITTHRHNNYMAMFAVLIFILFATWNSQAQIPHTLSYQGILADSSGTPKPDGTYNFTFRLYGVSSGGSALWTETQSAQVKHGLFSAILGSVTPIPDAVSFDRQYWLGIQLSSEPELSPRTKLAAVGYAFNSSKADTARYAQGIIPAGPIAVNTSGNAVVGNSTNGRGLWGTSQTFHAVVGETNAPSMNGVWGKHDSANGSGVYGSSVAGYGVFGASNNTGVYGYSANGLAVLGNSFQYGVKGLVSGTTGSIGVWGEATANTTDVRGVYGRSNSPAGHGVVGEATATSGICRGVWGISHSPGGAGVFGENTDPNGWAGYFTGKTYFSGAMGIGLTNPASKLEVNGGSTNGASIAIHGLSNDNYGVYGSSNTSLGVYGISGSSMGVRGESQSASGYGVYGVNNVGGISVYGHSPIGVGVFGEGQSGITGWGIGASAAGVYGSTDGSPNSDAARFQGDVSVNGSLSVSGNKNFRIDHPLDPANKTLIHSCVESNERLLIYSGTVVTNGNGDATIELPSYFEALNINYRYQLTVVGRVFAQVRIEDEISNNRFSIKTDKPNIKICWEVTGDRNDAFSKANPFVVEKEKSPTDRGKYYSPELFGQPKEMQIGYRPLPKAQNSDNPSIPGNNQAKEDK